MLKLNLEWRILDPDHIAVVIDKTTYLAFQSVADTRGQDTQNMITEALARLLEPPWQRAPIDNPTETRPPHYLYRAGSGN